MAVITRNPTSNTSPDPGLGGAAVSNPINTGHSNTTATLGQTKSCLWSGLPATILVLAARLKFDWSITAASLAGDGNNVFQVDYSTNGGSSFSNALDKQNKSAPESGSVDISLGVVTIANIQIRDLIQSIPNSGSASITVNISNIRVEVSQLDEFVPISS